MRTLLSTLLIVLILHTSTTQTARFFGSRSRVAAHPSGAEPRRATSMDSESLHVAAANRILTAREITADDHARLVNHFSHITFPHKGTLVKTPWLNYKASRAEKKARKSGDTTDVAKAGYRRALQIGHMLERFKEAHAHTATEASRNKLELLQNYHKRHLSGTLQKYKEIHRAGSLSPKLKAEHNELAGIGRRLYGRAERVARMEADAERAPLVEHPAVDHETIGLEIP